MRYYFDFENVQETVRDEAGVEVDDLEQALVGAQSAIQEMAGEVVVDDPGEAWALVVRDEIGSSVARLPIEQLPSSDRCGAARLNGRCHLAGRRNRKPAAANLSRWA